MAAYKPVDGTSAESRAAMDRQLQEAAVRRQVELDATLMRGPRPVPLIGIDSRPTCCSLLMAWMLQVRSGHDPSAKWRLSWMVLLGTCWVPLVIGAVYADDNAGVPQLQWYWMWPLFLVALMFVLTALPDYHVMLRPAPPPDTLAWGSSDDGGAYTCGRADVERFWNMTVTMLIILLCAATVVMTVVFATRDYFTRLDMAKHAVDVTPGVLAMISTAMGLAGLVCRLREVYMLDEAKAEAARQNH